MLVIAVDGSKLLVTRTGIPPLKKTTSTSKAGLPLSFEEAALSIENWLGGRVRWPLSDVDSSETSNLPPKDYQS